MISEVNNELFTLCEDAVTEIVEPFLDKMRLEYDPDFDVWDTKSAEIIEEAISGLSLAQKFTIACYKIELEDDSPGNESKLPDHDYLVDWFHFQWECSLEDEEEE